MSVNFDKIVDRNGTYCTQWDFTVDRFGKEGVLPFSISDMDFQSPGEILTSIRSHVNHGIFGYTRWAHNDYKDAIINWYGRRFNTLIKSEWIVYSPSVIYTISKLIEILSSENENIVIQSPGYDAFFKLINSTDRQLLINELKYENNEYSIDMEDLESLLALKRTKILLLCNPHNPTGRVWTKYELSQIIELCDKYNVKIISDDIHMDIVYTKKAYTPVTKLARNKENIFICSSGSKTFNTPSLGGSYAFIPDPIARESFLNIMKRRDGVSNASIFGILSIINGYDYAEYWVDDLVYYLYNNLQTVYEFIRNELPILNFHIPESTYLAWIDCTNLNITDQEFQKSLINDGNVGIMPGNVYGAKNGFLRMNVGCPQKKLLKGLERLKLSVNALDYLK